MAETEDSGKLQEMVGITSMLPTAFHDTKINV